MRAALLFLASLSLVGCASFHIPLGANEQYGSIDVTARYNPPESLGDWTGASRVTSNRKQVLP